MKKIFLLPALLVISSFASVQISDAKWMQDYETLVALNGGTVSSDLKGLDLNKNGIRDDIEYYVLHKYGNKPFEMKIFLDAAKTLQKIISLPENAPKQERIALDNRLINLYTCRDYMLYKLDVPNITKKLREKMIFKSKVLNTNLRLRTYIEHKEKLPLIEEDIYKMNVDEARISCEKRYQQSLNHDLASSK